MNTPDQSGQSDQTGQFGPSRKDADIATRNVAHAVTGKEAEAAGGNDPDTSSREMEGTVPGGSPLSLPVDDKKPAVEEFLYDEHGHRYLSSEAINAWRIAGAFGSMVYWMIPLGYGTLTMGASGWPIWPAYVLGIIFFTNTVLQATVIPWIRWKRWRYHVDQNEIDLRRGLFVVVRTLIPMKRIQHVDTRQGPVYRQFGLASVTVTTAGDTHEIPALSEPVADELRNKISEYARVAREDL